MSKIELTVAAIHAAQHPSEAFSLILKEKEGDRYVPIIIGMSEARAILVELNQSHTQRPLTHELFASLCDNIGCRLTEVDIVHYENGVYFADMLMMRPDNTIFFIDARPSDAIALALKAEVPFYMNEDVFNANCLEDRESEEEETFNPSQVLTETQEIRPDAYIEQKLLEMSTQELQALLDGAVESEDFELASKIQEELNRRK
ncbi:MAG: bifunctional nuclease family protein [Bacteroidales bacterium]|nr:bifunctional nuclease family protein [Bacteroidales bacterium]MBR0304369.1 bifunctional nuclease family protein [Bacteroidales bacterium]